MEDKKIKCIDYHKDFVFTAAVQQFYEEKGYDEPKRCKDCRNKRKLRKEAVAFDGNDSSNSAAHIISSTFVI